MNKILALWAVPRSTSTVFEWMMRQRGDFVCHHEPFGEAWYYGEDRRAPRPTQEVPRAGLCFAGVWEKLCADATHGRVFIKEFPHYVAHLADDAFLAHFHHSFLIRDPAKVLPAMFAHWPDFTLEETGFKEQRELFDRLTATLPDAPPVVDSDDLLDDPTGTVRAYCKAVGIPFVEEALEWEPGERAEVSWYDKGSWHDKLRESRGFVKQKREYLSVDANNHLRHAYDACKPHFDALRAHRMRPQGLDT
jgi:hypothetical protein